MIVNIMTGREATGLRPLRFDPDDPQRRLAYAPCGACVPDVRRRRIEQVEGQLQAKAHGGGSFANESRWRELAYLYRWIGDCRRAEIYDWMLRTNNGRVD